MFRNFTLSLSILLLAPFILLSQDVILKNASFEGHPQTGKTKFPLKGWTDCGGSLFNTPPDLHGKNTNFWKAESKDVPSGKTYLCLVTREDGTYESVSQKLSRQLQKDHCYAFSISLSQHKNYLSHTKKNQRAKTNFNSPVIFRLWGSHFQCISGELLASTKPINHESWITYQFLIKPKSDYSYVTLEASFETASLEGYNGNLCLDKASHFIQVPCDGNTLVDSIFSEEALVVEELIADTLDEHSPSEDVKEIVQNPTIREYLEEGRKYGLFRYTSGLSKDELDHLIDEITTYDLPVEPLNASLELTEKLETDGHTEENLKRIRFFNSYTEWQEPIKEFLKALESK